MISAAAAPEKRAEEGEDGDDDEKGSEYVEDAEGADDAEGVEGTEEGVPESVEGKYSPDGNELGAVPGFLSEKSGDPSSFCGRAISHADGTCAPPGVCGQPDVCAKRKAGKLKKNGKSKTA